MKKNLQLIHMRCKFCNVIAFELPDICTNMQWIKYNSFYKVLNIFSILFYMIPNWQTSTLSIVLEYDCIKKNAKKCMYTILSSSSSSLSISLSSSLSITLSSSLSETSSSSITSTSSLNSLNIIC